MFWTVVPFVPSFPDWLFPNGRFLTNCKLAGKGTAKVGSVPRSEQNLPKRQQVSLSLCPAWRPSTWHPLLPARRLCPFDPCSARLVFESITFLYTSTTKVPSSRPRTPSRHWFARVSQLRFFRVQMIGFKTLIGPWKQVQMQHFHLARVVPQQGPYESHTILKLCISATSSASLGAVLPAAHPTQIIFRRYLFIRQPT